MRIIALCACLCGVAGPAAAELTNRDAPVIVGHYHLNVSSIPEHLRFWVDTLGGREVKLGPAGVTAVEFPDATSCSASSRRPARPAARRSITSASRCRTCRR